MTLERPQKLEVPGAGTVSALLVVPPRAWALYVFAHGAGAGMTHPFMAAIAESLDGRGIATLRYQFPYMESGRGAPDRQPVLLATVRAAVAAGLDVGLPMVAGGKSMGGRMTSLAAAAVPLPQVRGLAFLGFPLHSPSTPGNERAAHLANVAVPMLFVQGTRDSLARLDLLEPVLSELGPRATLRVVDGGDHSFKVPKTAGRTTADVMDELASGVDSWMRALL